MKEETSYTKDKKNGNCLFGLLARKNLIKSRQMHHLKVWQRALAEKWGQARAAQLAARIQTCYDELSAARPRPTHRALNGHLNRGILPGLALYQVLQEETGDQATALAEWDRLFRASVTKNSKSKLLRLLRRLSNPFPVFRWANRRTLQRQFPPAGWTIEWIEDSNRCIAYNIHNCFYGDVLAEYGTPELTAHFCRLDDVMFESLPPTITWERTQTLALGGDCCNFRWCYAPRRLTTEKLGKDGTA
ncbi:MAG: L-2-amino-thiazoline-4-carboxylic acid hydrolase [Anaerolineae bacterium]